MRRILARDIPGRPRLTKELAEARLSVQWPQEQKVARATHVIDSRCSLSELEGRVKEIHDQLIDGRKS